MVKTEAKEKLKTRWWAVLLILAVLAIFLPFWLAILLVVGWLISYIVVLDVFYSMTAIAVWLSKKAPKNKTQDVASVMVVLGKLLLFGIIVTPFIYAGLHGKLGFSIIAISPFIVGLVLSIFLGRLIVPSVWQSNLEKTRELTSLVEGKTRQKTG